MERTVEDKLAILQEAGETKNISQVCRKYRLSPRLFRSWRAKLKKEGQAGLERSRSAQGWISYPVLEESWTPEGHRITNFRCKSHRADEERKDEFKFDLLIAGGLRIEGVKFTWGSDKYVLPNVFQRKGRKVKKVLFLEDGPLKNSLNLHLDSLCIAAIRAGSTLFRVDVVSPPPFLQKAPRTAAEYWAEPVRTPEEQEQRRILREEHDAWKDEMMARYKVLKEERVKAKALETKVEPSLWPEDVETKEVKPKGFNNEFDFPLDASGYPLPSGHSSHEGDAE